MIVVDASVTLAWCHPDEHTPAVLRILEQVATGGAIVPAIWPLEIANSLAMAVRKGRIDRSFRDELLANLRRLRIDVEASQRDLPWFTTINIADRHELTVYDASYLELAMRTRLPLATLDTTLIRAARAEGLEVLP